AVLDTVAIMAGIIAFVSAGWTGSAMHPSLASFFAVVTADRAVLILIVALVLRLSLGYPQFLKRASGALNLLESLRTSLRGDAFWLGTIWAVTGFLMSLGTHSWLYRILYDWVFLFRGMR